MPDTSLLINESPLTVSPTLARYIGLNEALFLQQLHFIITKNDKVGKLADGRKWYRDKPSAFIEKYFPFWDESTLRRTMDNLRDDNLLLTRSDLNTRPRDRSLWYSINYQALNQLDSPVARILEKSQKRRKARQARPKATKVQNELLINNEGNEAATKVQNELATKVQNEQTPKDSKEPKDSFSNSIELERAEPKAAQGKASRKPVAVPAYQIYGELTGKWYLNKIQIKAIDSQVGSDPAALEQWRQVIIKWNLKGYKPIDIDGMLDWFRDGIPVYKNGASNNGHNQSYTRQNGATGESGESLANKPTVNIYDD